MPKINDSLDIIPSEKRKRSVVRREAILIGNAKKEIKKGLNTKPKVVYKEKIVKVDKEFRLKVNYSPTRLAVLSIFLEQFQQKLRRSVDRKINWQSFSIILLACTAEKIVQKDIQMLNFVQRNMLWDKLMYLVKLGYLETFKIGRYRHYVASVKSRKIFDRFVKEYKEKFHHGENWFGKAD